MQEKIKDFVQAIKQNISETFRLLKQFKWSISIYVLFYAILFISIPKTILYLE